MFLFLTSVAYSYLQAQTGEISGVVRDAISGQSLPGVAILYKNTGTITDGGGRFTLHLSPGPYTLRFRFLGYETYTLTTTVTAGQRDTFTILLKPSTRNLNLVVITSSLYEKNIAQETVSMEVIPSKQITNTNSNDVGEVVSRTSGILVQDNQISIRGGSSFSYGVGARTAVLVDGLSLTSGDLADIQSKLAPVENIRQVEVIKGASSVAYGSSAMNGVINIITDWPTEEKGRTTVGLNSGMYSNPPARFLRWWDGAQPFFTMININHQRRAGRLSYAAGGNCTQINSYLEAADEMRIRGFFKTRVTHRKKPGFTYGLNGLAMHESSDRFFISRDMDSSIFFQAQGSADRYWRFTLDPHLQYADAKGHFFRIYSRWLHIFRRGNGSDPDAASHSFLSDTRYQRRIWGERLVVSAGVPFLFSTNRSNLYPGTRLSYAAAAYLQAEGQPLPRLSLIGGIRYEFNKIDKYFSATDPILRTGINFKASRSTFLRASWGQAYRLPSIGERFLQQEFTAGIFVFPNPTLKTEKAWSAEWGLMQAINISRWKALLDLALFWQEYQNFVEYRAGFFLNKDEYGKPLFPDQGSWVLGLKPFNVDNARIVGYEVSLRADGRLGPVSLTLQGGYMYHWPSNLDSLNTDRSVKAVLRDAVHYMNKRITTDEEQNKILLFRSRHLVRGDLEAEYSNFSLGLSTYYTSLPEKAPALFIVALNIIDGGRNTFLQYMDRHRKGDWIFDVRCGYQINEKLRLGFIVKNITNRVYALRPGRPEPLRHFTVQLRWTI